MTGDDYIDQYKHVGVVELLRLDFWIRQSVPRSLSFVTRRVVETRVGQRRFLGKRREELATKPELEQHHEIALVLVGPG